MPAKVTFNFTNSKYGPLLKAASTRRQVKVRIRFLPGVGHTNWINGKHKSAAQVANILINGGGKIPARPIFNNYIEHNEAFIQECIQRHLTLPGHDSLQTKLTRAGNEIKKDLVKQLKLGQLGLIPNQGKYAKRKAGARKVRYRVPFLATGEILSALGVTIE